MTTAVEIVVAARGRSGYERESAKYRRCRGGTNDDGGIAVFVVQLALSVLTS